MQFERFKLIVGEENFNKIQNTRVLLVGVGGVGSFVFEGLVRSGVLNIDIVDFDKVDITNLNRQLMTNLDNIGKDKVDVIEDRGLSINKDLKVGKYKCFLDKDNIDNIDFNYDYVIDCCDCLNTKKEIISKCLLKKVKFITCMGTGNKLDPSKLEIIDIRKTSYDPLARRLRKWVNDNRIKGKILCCASLEKPIKNNTTIIGSCSFVPSSAGLLIVSYIIRDIIKRLN